MAARAWLLARAVTGCADKVRGDYVRAEGGCGFKAAWAVTCKLALSSAFVPITKHTHLDRDDKVLLAKRPRAHVLLAQQLAALTSPKRAQL